MAHYAIYRKYQEKLVKCLPMDDDLFISKLIHRHLLPGDTLDKINGLSTQPEKALYFLDHVIEPALAIDDASYFNELLFIMNKSDYMHVKRLAQHILHSFDKSESISLHRSFLKRLHLTEKSGMASREDVEMEIDQLEQFKTSAKRDTVPSLKDLYQHITPQYAASWCVIGRQLGLPGELLMIIEADNHSDCRQCCNAMLEKWLMLDPTASWRQLFTVLESPAVSCGQKSKSLHQSFLERLHLTEKSGMASREDVKIEIDQLEQFKTSAKKDTVPSLKDLYQHITPQYASNWRVIGTQLGLPANQLMLIEIDNHNDCRRCCNAMLQKWLMLDPTASWRKLFTVLESPAVSCGQESKSLHQSLFERLILPEKSGMASREDVKVKLDQLEQFKTSAKRDTVPSLKDLYQHITPQYAASWHDIGLQLGLPNGRLKAIKAEYPNNVKWCCNIMLEQWLKMDPTASWKKLFSVIESLAVSISQDVDFREPEELTQFKAPDKVNTCPSMRDLFTFIVPKHSAKWKMLGSLLGVSSSILNIIAYDYQDSTSCCAEMLQCWLQNDPNATWGKLLEVIELLK